MNDNYAVPSQTRIGHVHLKVSNLDRALGFYRDLLGFELTTMYGENAAFISAGGIPQRLPVKHGVVTSLLCNADFLMSNFVSLNHYKVVTQTLNERYNNRNYYIKFFKEVNHEYFIMDSSNSSRLSYHCGRAVEVFQFC